MLVRHSHRVRCARGMETGDTAVASCFVIIALEVGTVLLQMGEPLACLRL